jgi:hypothetical protein
VIGCEDLHTTSKQSESAEWMSTWGKIRRNRKSCGSRTTREDGAHRLFRRTRYNSQCRREGRGVGEAGANYRGSDGPEGVPVPHCAVYGYVFLSTHLSIEQINHFRQKPSHPATGCQSF